jgi:hypothetical protein
MPEPIAVRIPHSLGKLEATRRIETGVGRWNVVLPKMVRVEQSSTKTGEIFLAVRALGQIATASVIVESDYVLVEATVPTFLAPFVDKAKSFTKSYGSKLLTGPTPRN